MSRWLAAWSLGFMLAGLPASSNFQLNSYGFGNGGTAGSSSSHYAVNGTAGEVAGSVSSTNFKIGAGENQEKQANVPTITITNGARWYNKLLIKLGIQGNPSDALYAVAISTDGFTTTNYIQSDLTIGSTLNISNFQTFAAWGGAGGVIISGLAPSTVYTVKAAAYRGKFTQSPWGPTSSAATVSPELSFEIDVAPTDTTSSPPYDVDFGTLLVSTVTTATDRVWVSLDTNGESGGSVYISGANGGLKSLIANYLIASSNGNLAGLSEGFGLQGASATQTSGGPLSIVSPYNVIGTNVGIEDPTIRPIFNAPAPIIAGRGSIFLMAKTKPLTPSSSDYSEVLTAIASASF